MDKKRVILIGRSMAGKTTLCQYINNEEIKYYKTQTVHLINDHLIDTPGEYLERRYMRGALSVSAADADIIMLVQDATEDGTMFPPNFSSMYCKPCVGIITKSDIATPKQLEYAEKYLKLAGAGEIFITSSMKGTGFKELMKYFEEDI
ncbi:EutP/PduV family microcompartment system protein [Aminipila terrae]|uniref:EutP/PduV family microcompartment system protein n=1 Tax=Aminipila terrae TaxID=2697030 RepID=A0A6P1MDD9_9FIRM|nr:EutP/PduV family microcompartment system protein [Aminipila terrae]QHI71143.1 EutP/PduV family microcompartment system protein [Aminipila terrae]